MNLTKTVHKTCQFDCFLEVIQDTDLNYKQYLASEDVTQCLQRKSRVEWQAEWSSTHAEQHSGSKLHS